MKNKETKKKDSNKERKNKKQKRWIVFITILTFFLAMGFNLISELMLNNQDILVSFIILLAIIGLGIFFDMVGIAVASADITPFNAMASSKLKGSKEAVNIVKNASQVSNICNDVVGDICGIISGATAISIIFQVGQRYDIADTFFITVILNGIVAAFTVGGKAFGKDIALSKTTKIVYRFGYLLSFFSKKS